MIRVLILTVLCVLAACAPPTGQPSVHPDPPNEQIDDARARTIMARAVASAGGWETWIGIDSIRYVKRSVLYHADGSVEKDVTEHHAYQLRPTLAGEINWTEIDTPRQIIYNDREAYRTALGERIANSSQSAYQAFMSAYYVLFVPFKLLDPGTSLTYEGTDTVAGAPADVIKASYDPGKHHNHSTRDTWWYYFDQHDGRHLGSMVYHAPTYALIENTETTDAHRIRFNTYRESFRCDSLRNKKFLRGVFYYSDYVLK